VAESAMWMSAKGAAYVLMSEKLIELVKAA
jgi:hypothetical protein